MSSKALLEKCARVLGPSIHVASINALLTEIETHLANPEPERIVIQMNGGLVENVVSEIPVTVLKIEEAGDLEDDEDLLTMYPENGGSFYQGGEHTVYARTFEAECNPAELSDTFTRFDRAKAELVNQDTPDDNPGM